MVLEVKRGIKMNISHRTLIILLLVLFSGCASVPPQVAQLHQKELEIINSLQKSHMAMVDAYVDQKILAFEEFFFSEYGPEYLKNWQNSFKSVYGRDYDEERDFPLLYSDLVAEYQIEVAPIEDVRKKLHDAISREYRHAIAAHEAVDSWIKSYEKLNAAQRESIDQLLGAIKPGLSLDSVDKAKDEAMAKVKARLSEFLND